MHTGWFGRFALSRLGSRANRSIGRMASMVGVADGCGVRLVLGSGPFEADFSAAEGAVAYCLDFDFHS